MHNTSRLLTRPSWVYPKARFHLDFVNGRAFGASVDQCLSITQTGTVDYAQKNDGTLQQFIAANILRRTNKGLRVMSGRSNIWLHSEVIGDATNWTNGGSFTSSQNSVVAPNGATTAAGCTIVDTTSATSMQLSGQTAGTTTAISLFAKKSDTGAAPFFRIATNNTSAWSTGISQRFPLTNDWQRFVLIGVAIASGTTIKLMIGNVDETGAEDLVCVGNVDFWGVQVENGAYATDYIPTTSASAARGVDNIAIIGPMKERLAQATGSAIVVVNSGIAGIASNVLDSNGTNLLGFNSSDNPLASISGALTGADIGNRTSRDILALSWSPSGRSLSINGGPAVTDTTAQTPSTPLSLGSTGAANFLEGYVEQLAVF